MPCAVQNVCGVQYVTQGTFLRSHSELQLMKWRIARGGGGKKTKQNCRLVEGTRSLLHRGQICVNMTAALKYFSL